MRADSLVFDAQGADNTIQQPRNSGDEAHREAWSRDATPPPPSHTFIVSPAEESFMTTKSRLIAALIVLLARFATAAAARTKAEATKPI
jgi:hypothetical protein